MRFRGKTALVTGASVGIGRAIALTIAEGGGRVGLVARSARRLGELRDSIGRAGGEAREFVADLRDEDAINEMWSAVVDAWGGVDILVNAAGVWHGEGTLYLGPSLMDTPAEQINEILDVGIRAPMLLTRLVLPGMVAKKSGKILNVSGELRSAAGWLHYYVSKKALEDFTAGLAEELRPHEIQVNCISPSDTLTETYREFFPGYDLKDVLDPSEVAKFAVFLLSGDADHITGSITVVRAKTAHATGDAHETLLTAAKSPEQG